MALSIFFLCRGRLNTAAIQKLFAISWFYILSCQVFHFKHYGVSNVFNTDKITPEKKKYTFVKLSAGKGYKYPPPLSLNLRASDAIGVRKSLVLD